MADGPELTVANVGDVLAGKYRVDRVLGIGGMGMVVAATHLELEQKVALKLMLADPASSGALMDRFLREARAVVRLRGENVCRVFDVGRLPNQVPYIVMELMDGEDLGRTIAADAPLRVDRAVHFMLQAIEGVAEAHAHRIVHRDLKPGNLFVTSTSDGAPLVKVLDFGISKSPADGGLAPTRTGDVMGSPGYMAPEQMVSSKDVDMRADVWSLGVILYQMLAARMPWQHESLPVLCMAVMSDPPPPLPEGLPPGLVAAVMRCLEKDRAARFADVAELALAIAPYGPAGAMADATRIANVLRRRAVVAAAAMEAAGVTAPLGPAARRAAHAVDEPAHASTLQSSPAEIARTPRRRTWRIAGGLAAVAGLVAVIAAVASRDNDRAIGDAPATAAAVPTAAASARVVPVPVPVPVPKPAVPPAVVVEPPPAPAPVAVAKPAAHVAPPAHNIVPPPARVPAPPAPATTPALTPAPAPVAPAPKTDDNPWDHMQHDKP